jgi:hypothetical protein
MFLRPAANNDYAPIVLADLVLPARKYNAQMSFTQNVKSLILPQIALFSLKRRHTTITLSSLVKLMYLIDKRVMK